MAEESLRRIGRLYEVERTGKDLTFEERKILRQDARLELQKFYDWLSQIRRAT